MGLCQENRRATGDPSATSEPALSLPKGQARRPAIGERNKSCEIPVKHTGKMTFLLVTLYFFRPVTRLQTLMGDMGQITIAFSSFQTQVALFLLETDKDDRRTMGKAAQNIGKAACSGVELIQHYFEPEERHEETGSALARRATESIRETSQVLRESLAA